MFGGVNFMGIVYYSNPFGAIGKMLANMLFDQPGPEVNIFN